MQPIRIGIHLASLRQPLKKGLVTAARLGADAVEIDARTDLRPEELSETGLRQIRKLLGDVNLRVSAVRFSTRRGYQEQQDLDRRVEATRAAMKMAYDLRASCVVNYVGRIPAESGGRDWDMLTATLGDLGLWSQKVGAPLAARTGPDAPERLLELVESIPAGGIGVDFDPAGLIMHNHSPLEAAQLLAAHIVHVHARDGARDLAAGQGVEVELGRGTAEFPILAAALEAAGYSGYFTIERTGGNDPINDIGNAVQYLRSLG